MTTIVVFFTLWADWTGQTAVLVHVVLCELAHMATSTVPVIDH
jgi:hypothetical protein